MHLLTDRARAWFHDRVVAGNTFDAASLKGNVTLIINVASF